MIKVNVYQAKARLSELIDLVAKGEKVLLCKRNVPYVVMTPVHQTKPKVRPMGLARGKIKLSKNFFDDMTDDELRLWQGDNHTGTE